MPKPRGVDGVTPARVRMNADARRRQLAEVAARQFHRLGFHQVSLADVADSVGLTAPAVYRHFRSKQDLLAAAVSSAIDAADEATSSNSTLESQIASLAEVAVRRRDLSILLQRELRHLDETQRQALEERFAGFVRRLRDGIRDERPDLDEPEIRLLTTATLGALSSPGQYNAKVSANDQRRALVAAATAVCFMKWPPPATRATADSTASHPGVTPSTSRSDELLESSIRLFHDSGYAAVSIDDIGASVGIAGPSIYYHYATKSDLLLAAFTRATEWLAVNGGSETSSVEDLMSAYVDLAIRDPLLIGVFVHEVINLPPEAARRVRAGVNADIETWSLALNRERPDLSDAEALALVQAAHSIVNDVVRVPALHERDSIAADLRGLVHATLTAPIQD